MRANWKVYAECAWYAFLLYAFLTFLTAFKGEDVHLFSLPRFVAVWIIWYPIDLYIELRRKEKNECKED